MGKKSSDKLEGVVRIRVKQSPKTADSFSEPHSWSWISHVIMLQVFLCLVHLNSVRCELFSGMDCSIPSHLGLLISTYWEHETLQCIFLDNKKIWFLTAFLSYFLFLVQLLLLTVFYFLFFFFFGKFLLSVPCFSPYLKSQLFTWLKAFLKK